MAIEGSFAARRCSVLDISEGGAKIKIDDPTFVRPMFQLKFSRAPHEQRSGFLHGSDATMLQCMSPVMADFVAKAS
jgi:hypothetical protein